MNEFVKLNHKEDPYYDYKPEDVDSFDELSQQIQDDLIEWYNMVDPDKEDKDRLLKLYRDGKFRAWDCPHCNERVFEGEPDDWGHFQGTNNQDFSYFGNRDKYAAHYIEAMCDHCRCYG